MSLTSLIFAVLGVSIGFATSYFLLLRKGYDEQSYRLKAERFLADAENEGEEIVKEAQTQAGNLHEITQREIIQLEQQIKKLEQMLKTKEEIFAKRNLRNMETKKTIDGEVETVAQLRRQEKEIIGMMDVKLLERTRQQKDAVKNQMFIQAESELRDAYQERFPKLEEWLKENAVRDAKNILGEAIYRYALPTSVEKDSGELEVTKDSVKGIIVGRGGSNIALFEELFGVDVVFNDAPNIISLSCFNLVTKETARIALKKLMNEKIVDEAVIRRTKEWADKEILRILEEEGKKAVQMLGLKDLHPDFVKLVGRLQFRTSYGQNIMGHCMEVGYFSKLLAETIGADSHVAFLGGFFHDIGKAIDQEVGGSHDVLSKEILEKYGFPWEIVHAAWTHHDAIPQETVEAVLVKAADAISAGRPGARSLSLEQYIQKIRELEATASSFEGVKKAFAISAGREVRAIIDSEKMGDEGSVALAKTIAQKIEEKGGYPGKIKVVTIRVTRASDVAKQKVLKIPSRSK